MRMCDTISRDPGIRQEVALQHLRGSNSISLKVRFLLFPPTSTGVQHSLDEAQKPRLKFLLTLFSYPEIVLYLQNLRHKLTSGACFLLLVINCVITLSKWLWKSRAAGSSQNFRCGFCASRI